MIGIASLGSGGVGLVWGWTLGWLGGGPGQGARNAWTAATATLLLAGEVLWLGGWDGLIAFGLAFATALAVHRLTRAGGVEELELREGAKGER